MRDYRTKKRSIDKTMNETSIARRISKFLLQTSRSICRKDRTTNEISYIVPIKIALGFLLGYLHCTKLLSLIVKS